MKRKRRIELARQQAERDKLPRVGDKVIVKTGAANLKNRKGVIIRLPTPRNALYRVSVGDIEINRPALELKVVERPTHETSTVHKAHLSPNDAAA